MPEITNHTTLQDALKQLHEISPRSAGPLVEAHLRVSLRRRRRMRFAWYSAAAALFVLTLGWFSLRRSTPASQPPSALSTFIALPYGQNDVPLGDAVIVRVEIQSASGPVAADLLVGQDGMARAVRLVQ